jgi:DNA-binding NarL/FixJ family response regulator
MMNQERYDEASQYLAAARDMSSACAARYQIALTRMSQAQLAILRGNPDAARLPLEESRATFKALGASPALKQAEELAAQIRIPRTDAPNRLSAREQQVLALLVLGKSDRLIADQLFISPRTVMQHVANIMRKLDVDSRTAAAVEAVRRELV